MGFDLIFGGGTAKNARLPKLSILLQFGGQILSLHVLMTPYMYIPFRFSSKRLERSQN